MVSKKEIVPKIGNIIADIVTQYEYLSQNLTEINELEMELFMSNATFLSDHIAVLQQLTKKEAIEKPNEQKKKMSYESALNHTHAHNSSAKPTANGVPYQENDLQTITDDLPLPQEVAIPNWKQSLTDELAETQFDFEKKEFNQLDDYLLTSTEQQVIDQKNEYDNTSSIPFSVTRINTTSATTSPRVKDKLVGDCDLTKPSINDIHRKSSLPRQFDGENIKDLKRMITTNDRLLFIKELFGGYSLAYNEAIQLLNQLNSFEEANRFLQTNYANHNNWTDKMSYVDKLYQILKTRY